MYEADCLILGGPLATEKGRQVGWKGLIGKYCKRYLTVGFMNFVKHVLFNGNRTWDIIRAVI